ncbi:MAG: sigma-70 family RNA polymerase sigma factor [Planctomycetes bacterium]|nr:sigma-70 family RNA polymerase sigma factor [Planctomycetota bacterium]
MTAMTSEAPDDATLVARCLGGDAAAWADLVARHGPLAWGVIRRTGLAPDDAADVYQTTWLAAVEQLPRLREPSRFPAWIARTAHLQALRVRRSYGISRRVLSRIEPRESDGRVPEDEIAAIEDRSRVAEALDAIGDRCAALLRVLYFEHPTPAYQDISARLKMPVGSIGPTRARCLERLAKRLGLGDEVA